MHEEGYVCDEVECLFTSIPFSKTIDYIMKEIFKNKLIKAICKSKLIFYNCIFTVNDNVIKENACCSMGGAISSICMGAFDMSSISMGGMEKERVLPLKPNF